MIFYMKSLFADISNDVYIQDNDFKEGISTNDLDLVSKSMIKKLELQIETNYY